jgi:hypothetical protein
MNRNTQSQALAESISRLQIKQSQELALLKDQFHLTYESLKPINLIKHTFKEAVGAPELKEGMVNNVIGMTTGYFTKAILIGSSVNPIKKILGTLLQFTVATLVAKNSDTIRILGKIVVNKIFKRSSVDGQKFPNNGNGLLSETLKIKK